MKTIYFVRHGESEANARRITAGGGLDVDITQHGVNQAVKVGTMLNGKGVQLIVSSPQKRAFHTAAVIAKVIGYDPEKIITNDKFVERHLGVMTGKPHDEVQLWFDMGVTPEGGESSLQLHDRIAEGLEWLKTLDADKIVLVSHGGPGRMIRAIFRDEGHKRINTLASIGNAQILELRI